MSISSQRSFEYLEQLPGTTFRRLYQQPSAALAVFRRFLTPLAKHVATAMLFMNDVLPHVYLDSWIKPESEGEKSRSLDLLIRLHIIQEVREPGLPRSWKLTSPFNTSLLQALTGGGEHLSFGVPCIESDPKLVDSRFLDEFARSRWEAILYFIVGSAEEGRTRTSEISLGSKSLLELGGLVTLKGSKATITADGFTFLLQEVNVQVWDLLIIYLKYAEDVWALSMDHVDVLAFLFTLGSLDVGQDYSTEILTPTQKQMLEDLDDFGIVFRHRGDSSRFYPTRLATTLTSDSSALTTSLSSNRSTPSNALSGSSSRGFILVETNYRVYAYSSSPLQISILSLFCKLNVRYPNLVSGRLTKESIQRAVLRGITSQQIISYLAAHAHPQMVVHSRTSSSGTYGSQTAPILPPTVVDQIRLWQMEGDRMTTTQGWFFRDFKDREEYEEMAKFSETVGVLKWKSDAKRCFFVTRHEQLASYIKSKQRQQRENG